MVDIHCIRQKDPKGLGHAMLCAKTFVGNEPFAVLVGDDFVYSERSCLKQLVDCYDEYKTSILGVHIVPKKDVSKYEIVDSINIKDRKYKVKSLVHKQVLRKL